MITNMIAEEKKKHYSLLPAVELNGLMVHGVRTNEKNKNKMRGELVPK